jgi:hypothetical protein
MITALFDIWTGNPIPLLYSVCIKTIEIIKHPEFIKWHNDVHGVPQLPYTFLYMLHKLLSQLASFLTDLVNNNLVEHGNDGSKLTITHVLKIVKFVTRFFSNIENHIMEGSVPDSVLNFTSSNANPKIIQAATAIAPVGEVTALKAKSDALPPGTPACERNGKKQKNQASR